MEELQLIVLGVAVAAGVASHGYFQRHEPKPVPFIGVTLAITTALPALLTIRYGIPILTALRYSSFGVALYLFTLSLSIQIYRWSPWHPLAKFPGPALAKSTQAWFFWYNYQGTTRHLLKRLHEQYGDFVRIGPNEVSINQVRALWKVQGANGWPRTKEYTDGLLLEGHVPEESNLLTLRDYPTHSQRRKIWDKGFSTKALSEYEPLLLSRARQLCKRLSLNVDKTIDFHQFAGWFVYDMMSDLAFGGGFDLLKAGADPLGLLPIIVVSNSLHGLVDSMVWLKGLIQLIPTSDAITTVFNFTKARFEERNAKGSKEGIRDIFHYLLSEDEETGQRLNSDLLAKESQLIVGAGADTTRTTMTLTFLYLMQNPDILRRLQEELDTIFLGKEITVPELDKAPLLNAVVNEALRLQPPISSGTKRESPGAVLEGHFIPKGISVRFPAYVAARDPRYFSPDPDAFRPDRWLDSRGEAAFDRTAWFPLCVYLLFARRFLIRYLSNVGPMACIGKAIAMQELRIVTATVVMTFDLKLSSTFDSKKFDDSVTDRFLTEINEPLNMILTMRKDVDHHLADVEL